MLRSTPLTAVFWSAFLIVTCFNIAYAWNFLPSWIPIEAGFVRMADERRNDALREARVAQLEQKTDTRITDVQNKVDWQLKLLLVREIRDANTALCHSRSAGERDSLQGYIDQLIQEYTRVTGNTLPQPPCPRS